MKKIILRKFKYDSEEKGSSRGAMVCQRMNKNEKFAKEQPLVDLLKERKDAYEIAKAEAANRDTVKIAIKNDCYQAYIFQLDRVADGVEFKAEGDVKIAQDAGFETRSMTSRSIDFLEMPTGLKAEDVRNRKGFIKTTWDYDPDSVSTVVETQVIGEANATWQMSGSFTASSTLISGLPSGKYVAVRIYSTGRKGLKSDTTDSVTVLVS